MKPFSTPVCLCAGWLYPAMVSSFYYFLTDPVLCGAAGETSQRSLSCRVDVFHQSTAFFFRAVAPATVKETTGKSSAAFTKHLQRYIG